MKTIKFDLSMNGAKIATLSDFQENLTAEILPIFQSGKLSKWLKSRDLLEQATAIEAIDKNASELEQLEAMCQALGLGYDEKALQFLLVQHVMVVLPAGTFTMGGDDTSMYRNVQPLHPVHLKGFEIGRYPVTQAQWKAVMGSNPSYFTGEDNCPVENINWHDVQEYIQKLNKMTRKIYRLPSESEWEYACRGGEYHRYSGSSDIDEVAWYDRNSDGKTHPVGQKQPNGFGLYDMSGNVWEWCQDVWHDNYNGAPTDGSAWDGDSTSRVLRGGSWGDGTQNLRAAIRLNYVPSFRNYYFGFRLARTLA